MRKDKLRILCRIIGCSPCKPDRAGGGSLDKRVSPDVIPVLKVVWYREGER